MSRSWTTLGPLPCLVHGPADAKKAVVLFHGYGADAGDLAPFANMLPTPEPVRWVFPNGLLSVPIGMMMEGRAWFPIDMQALEEAIQAGTHRDLSPYDPPDLKLARDAALACIGALGLPMKDIVIGGFSQGAMVCTEVALYATEKPAGLAILSGALLAQERWSRALLTSAPVAFYQSHGEEDPLLDPAGAKQLHTLLTKAGWRGELMPFRGGHEIPPMVLMKLASFIADKLR